MFFFSNILNAIASLGHMVISVYILVVIASCVISWFRVNPYNRVVQVIDALTRDVFRFVHRFIHPSFNGIDFTPVIVILALELFDMIILKSLHQLGSV